MAQLIFDPGYFQLEIRIGRRVGAQFLVKRNGLPIGFDCLIELSHALPNSVDFLSGGSDLLCETCALSPYRRIGWDATNFAVLDKKENRRVFCPQWAGAVVVLKDLVAESEN